MKEYGSTGGSGGRILLPDVALEMLEMVAE